MLNLTIHYLTVSVSHSLLFLSVVRNALLSGIQSPGPKETEVTAELDNRGLLQLQTQVMKQQDQELEQMEKTVISTKVGRGEGEGGRGKGAVRMRGRGQREVDGRKGRRRRGGRERVERSLAWARGEREPVERGGSDRLREVNNKIRSWDRWRKE